MHFCNLQHFVSLQPRSDVLRAVFLEELLNDWMPLNILPGNEAFAIEVKRGIAGIWVLVNK